MIYFLLFASVLLGTLKNTFSKTLSAMNSSETQIHLTNFYTMGLAFFLFIILNKGFSAVSVTTMVVGILYAVFSLASQIALLQAMRTGPVAFTSLFFSCGFIISTILGAAVYKEYVHIVQILGIIILVVAMWISLSPGKMTNFSPKWLGYCAIAFVCAGIVGFMQKYHQKSSARDELNMMLIIAFGITCTVSLILCFCSRQKIEGGYINKDFLIYGLLLGLCIGLQNKNNLFLSGRLPSAIFFPISNGGIILGSTIAGSIIFKERFNKTQKIGLVAGIAAIALISIF